MFEHVIDTPTVIGRHNVPAMAQYVAAQFKAGGFPRGTRDERDLSYLRPLTLEAEPPERW